MEAADKVWVCVKGHMDDGHGSVEGQPERCSRCGGYCEQYTLDELAFIVRDHKELLGASRSWLQETEKRAKLLDSRGEARLINSDEALRTVINRLR